MQLQESRTPRNEEIQNKYSKNNVHKKSTRRVNMKQEKSRLEKKERKKNNNHQLRSMKNSLSIHCSTKLHLRAIKL